MLDRDRIPEDPDRPGHGIVSKDAVDLINAKLDELEKGLRRSLPLPQSIEQFGACRIRAYGDTVCYSIAELSRATMTLISKELYLPAAIVARSLLEHFASFHSLVKELLPLAEAGKCEEAYALVDGTAMRHTVKGLPEAARAPKVAKVIQALEDRMPSAKDNYEFLCQYGHPSAFSIWLFYGSDSHISEKKWNFKFGGWDPEQTFKWSFVVLGELRYFRSDLDKLNTCADLIAAKCPGTESNG